MAQYKVPQDVEADDKLIGPFSFRQFVYLLVAAGLIALAVGLFQLFPLLAIIPVPFAFFFLALALPLKKDQPMETYLAAIVSYYLKPHARVWMPGQKEATILITAPKIAEDVRTRDISSEEATHRLSFLADIVDTGGYAIKGAGASPMREDLVAEANATPDMFETYQSQVINRVIDQDKMARHETAVKEMQEAIKRNASASMIPEEPEESVVSNASGFSGPGAATGGTVFAGGAGRVIGRSSEMKIPDASAEIEAALKEEEKSPVVVMPGTTNITAQPEPEEVRLKPDIDVQNSEVVVQPDLTLGVKERKPTVRSGVYDSSVISNIMNATRDEMNMRGGAAKEMRRMNKNGTSMTRNGAAAKNETTLRGGNEARSKNGTENTENPSTKPINNSIIELANNKDFSVATIAKEANRINRKEKSEVFISLH